MSKIKPSAPSSASGSAAPADPPTFRSNPEVDAKIDAYVKENPKYWSYVQAMPRERLERAPKLKAIFDTIEQWTMTKTKFEAMDILNKYDIPCGPILSMKELSEDPSLRATGTVVEVAHPERGKYLSVGNPIKLSDSPTEVTRSPLLGEHTDEILRQVLGFSDSKVAEIHASGALDPPRKQAAE